MDDAIARTPLDHAVVWTGRPYAAKPGSLRATVLGLVNRPGEPVRLRDLLRQAARVDGDLGYNPTVVRDAVRLHQAARPTAYILVRRLLSGEHVAVFDVPYLEAKGGPLKAGEVVTDATGAWAIGVTTQAA